MKLSGNGDSTNNAALPNPIVMDTIKTFMVDVFQICSEGIRGSKRRLSNKLVLTGF